MARYDVRFDYDVETKTIYSSPSELDFIRPGDKIVFTGGTVSGFQAGWWTDEGPLSSGGYTLARHDADGNIDYVYLNVSGKTKTFKINIREPDTSPNAFGLTNVTNADPKALLSKTFSLTGFNKDITLTTSGLSSYFIVGYGNAQHRTSYGAKTTVTIRLFYTAPSDYGQSGTVTVKGGTRTETFTVTTRTYPTVDQKIEFPTKSGPVSLRDVGEFFGWAGSAPNLREYFRGGGLVPSIADNAGIPTSGTIKLTQFRGCASALYFTYRPPNKQSAITTLGGSKSHTLTWNILTDYTVGYGTLANDLDYRYVYTRGDSRAASEVTVTSRSGSPGTWGSTNTWVSFSASSPANTERDYHGTLTIYVRNRKDTSLVISKTVEWGILFYGP